MDSRWMMRCDAECLPDVAHLILAIRESEFYKGSMMTPNIYQASPMSHVKVTWMTMVPFHEMQAIIASIPDSHVMQETLVYDEVFTTNGSCA